MGPGRIQLAFGSLRPPHTWPLRPALLVKRAEVGGGWRATMAPVTSEPRVSRRIAAIAESATLAVDAKAKALKAAGEPVIGFGAGEPDFPTPGPHRRGRDRGLPRPGATTTTRRPPGCPSCEPRSPRRPRATPATTCDAAQVLVTNGGKHAVYNTFQTLLDPGDEVLLPAPYWTTLPRGDRARRAACRSCCRPPTRPGSGSRSTSSRRRAPRTPRRCSSCRRRTRPARCTRRPRSRRSVAGPSSTASGSSPTRSTST